MKNILIYSFLFLAAFSYSHADELVRPRSYFIRHGYTAVTQRQQTQPPTELDHDLAWPVQFVDAAHSVAQNYINFQDYGDGAYFHGGCDLRSPGDSDVLATASGVLEGGFYGYVMNDDGSMEKQWQPWKGQGSHNPYFELAIVTDQGYRFEYHHIDSEKLPATTIAALNQGGVRVTAGTLIGRVNGWAFRFENYPHIHYNIIRPDGVRVNPEFYSLATSDHTPPKIQGVYGVRQDGTAMAIKPDNVITDRLKEIVVAATESHDQDAYVQTPLFASVVFENGAQFSWDFRKFLRTADGRFPAIWSFFRPSLDLPDGRSLNTSGQFGRGLSLIRLPVPEKASGSFVITIGDTAGNQTKVTGNLVTPLLPNLPQ